MRSRGGRGLDPLKRLLIERTQGNPFFLEESVRTLVETGRWPASAAAIVWPPSCRRHAGAGHGAGDPCRPDRPPPRDDKRLLQTRGSVIGKDVPFPLLQAIADAPEEKLRAGSAASRAPSSCTRPASSPSSSTRSSTRSPTRWRTGGSSRSGDAICTRGSSTRSSGCTPTGWTSGRARLAHHAFRGEVWTKALAYLRQTRLTRRDRVWTPPSCGSESPGALWWSEGATARSKSLSETWPSPPSSSTSV